MCREMTSNTTIKVSENKSSFTIENKSELTIEKIKVDGGLIKKDETKRRCDYLFVIHPAEADKKKKQRAWYVELKGTDIKGATEQLAATLHNKVLDYRSAEKICFVVTTRLPKHGPSVQERKILFKRVHRVKLEIKKSPIEVSV